MGGGSDAPPTPDVVVVVVVTCVVRPQVQPGVSAVLCELWASAWVRVRIRGAAWVQGVHATVYGPPVGAQERPQVTPHQTDAAPVSVPAAARGKNTPTATPTLAIPTIGLHASLICSGFRKCWSTPAISQRNSCSPPPLKLSWCLWVSECHAHLTSDVSVCVCVCVYIEELEGNISESKRSEELLKLQETLCWPTLVQLHPGAYIPEVRGQGS